MMLCRFRRVILLTLASLLSGCALYKDSGDWEGIRPKALHEGHIIVMIPDARSALAEEVTADLATRHRVKYLGGYWMSSINARCEMFDVPEGTGIDRVVAALSAEDRVSHAQRTQRFTTFADALSYANYQYAPDQLGASELHRWTRGSGIRIAVVDTGADRYHPALRGVGLTVRDYVQSGDKGIDFDRDRHGTAVLGVIAAHNDDLRGISGIAPDAEFLLIKACWHPTENSFKARCSSVSLARAIDFAINADVDIINLSLAGPPDELITSLLDEAERRQILTVAAAGASLAETQAYPASLDNVIGVISSDKRGDFDTPTWTTGDAVVVAPGEEVITLAPGGGYELRSGSSLSSAHVAGLLALLIDPDTRPSPKQVRAALFGTGQPASTTVTQAAFAIKPDALAAYLDLRQLH